LVDLKASILIDILFRLTMYILDIWILFFVQNFEELFLMVEESFGLFALDDGDGVRWDSGGINFYNSRLEKVVGSVFLNIGAATGGWAR